MQQLAGEEPWDCSKEQPGSARCERAARVIGDRRAAEDVSQDVFLSLWERPESFDPTAASCERSSARSRIAAVTPAILATPTENGLTVHELVAHVEAIDRAFVDEATASKYGMIGAAEMPAITEENAARYAGESFATTVTRFRRTRAELIELADTLPADRQLGGYRRDDSLVIRAFETWMMRAMADLTMHVMPLAMAVSGTNHPDRTARVVLTGPGGGEWTIACGAGGHAPGTPEVVVTASVVDFCRRFADRLAPEAVLFTTDGDADLGRELVTAANAFAGLWRPAKNLSRTPQIPPRPADCGDGEGIVIGSLRENLRELRMSWRELDPAALSPRIAACVYFAAGLLAWGATHVTASGVDTVTLVSISIASAAFGAISIVLPWQRWPMRAQLVIPVFAFVLFAWGGILRTDGAAPFLAALPLPFVYVGFTQRPGTSSALAPVAAVSLLAAARFDMTQILAVTLLFALPVSVLVGEMIAQSQLQRSRAERRVDRLLLAVRTLGRVDDERAGADLVAMLASELLGAQAVAVLLADRRNGRRYRNRSFFGHPALADAAPLLLDGQRDAGAATSTRFVSLKRTHKAVRAAAIVPLPGDDGVPVGLVVAMWGTPKRALPAPARQAAELLSEEAGRMFQRLRAAAALEHDAHTDPLTQLANRRTFARALQTMQPNDALVIVDLDLFKTVNDRFGHQTGDDTLRALATCLRETARQVDCVARYGGEEFAVVVAGAGAAGAHALLRRMRRTWDGRNPITTFSAGIAVHDGTQSPNETLRRADAALYEAKANGRNRDVFATETEVVLP